MSDNSDIRFCFTIVLPYDQELWIRTLHTACVLLGDATDSPRDEMSSIARGILGEPCSTVGELFFSRQPDQTILYADMDGNIDYTTKLVQSYLKHFNRHAVISFEWSRCSDDLCLDSYGGGAAAVSKDNIIIRSTADMRNELEKKIFEPSLQRKVGGSL